MYSCMFAVTNYSDSPVFLSSSALLLMLYSQTQPGGHEFSCLYYLLMLKLLNP